MGLPKPYTIPFPLTAKSVGDMNQMFLQLYALTTVSQVSVTPAQTLTRVVVKL